MSRLKNEKIEEKYSDRDRSSLIISSFTSLTGDVEKRWTTFKNGFCKASEASLKYQCVKKKSGSSSRLGQLWSKKSRSEKNTQHKI